MEEEIRKEAHKNYILSGSVEGRDIENWNNAKKKLIVKYIDSLVSNGNLASLKKLDSVDFENYLEKIHFNLVFSYLDHFPSDNKVLIEMFDFIHSKSKYFLLHCDVEGMELIERFVNQSNFEIVDYLLDKGCHINSECYCAGVLLSSLKNEEMLKFLLDRGLYICYEECSSSSDRLKYGIGCYLSKLVYKLYQPNSFFTYTVNEQDSINYIKLMIKHGCHKYSETPLKRILELSEELYKKKSNQALENVISFIKDEMKTSSPIRIKKYECKEPIYPLDKEVDCLFIDTMSFHKEYTKCDLAELDELGYSEEQKIDVFQYNNYFKPTFKEISLFDTKVFDLLFCNSFSKKIKTIIITNHYFDGHELLYDTLVSKIKSLGIKDLHIIKRIN